MMDLEEIRRKAQTAITATDKEWAAIVNDLLDELEDLQEAHDRLLDFSDRQYYGRAN